MNIVDIFKNLGAAAGNLTGSDPILLNGSNNVWVVESGDVDFFVVSIKDGKPVGNLDPLMRRGPGDIFFGLPDLLEAGKAGIVVRGGPGTTVLALAPHKLFSQTGDREALETVSLAIHRWVDGCRESVSSKQLKEEINTACSSLLDTRPLTELLQAGELAASLDAFQRTYFALVRRQSEMRFEYLRNQMQEKDRSSKRFVANGMRQLAAILPAGKERPFIVDQGDSPLLAVCREIGGFIGVNIRRPPRSVDDDPEQGDDSLQDIARASRVRTRQVVLRGKWWNDDSGPLVGFMEKDERPVALIPVKPGCYELVDPAARTRIRVTGTIAEDLGPVAHMIYRPFPDRKLNWWDLIRFGTAGRASDVIWMVMMGAAGGILGTFVPLATGILFDTIIPGAERTRLYQIILILLAASLAGALFQITRGIAVVRVQGRMNASLQAAILDRVLELPTTFFRRYTAGELASRTMAVQAVNNLLSDTVVTSILGGVFGIFNIFLLFYFSPKLAVIALVLVACGGIATGWAGVTSVRHLKKLTAIQHRITGTVFQFISGITKLRITGSETRAYGIWASMFSRQRRVTFQLEQVRNRLEVFNSAYPHLAIMCIFAAYAFLVAGTGSSHDEGLSTGEFLAFSAAFGAFVTAGIEMSSGLLSVMTIQPYYENIRPILETLPETDDTRAAPGRLKGEIEVSNVSFRYIKDGPLILNDLSLHVKPQQFVAIVGGSGSGKSTLLRLLLGFETQESGAVFYDNKELSGIDIRMVRRQIGVVLQNAQLMSGDIFTNIVGASANLTIDDAWEAALAVGLAEDIEDMPMGMHTIIAEGGGGLSGGQRQRLVIARAIVHKPRILFFDEATSALDNRTQAMVTESLEQLQATRVVIAHRLSTIRNADCIFAIDSGSLVESGTYDELMEKNGYFAQLAQRQIA